MRRLTLCAGFALALVLLLPLLPVGPVGWAEEEARTPDDDVVEILTTESLTLEDFLKVVGLHAQMPFLWDPSTKELAHARFATARNLKVTRGGLFDLMRTVLASYDLALVPIGPRGYQVYRVMPMRELGGAAIVQPSFVEIDDANAEAFRFQHGLLVTTTLRTRHLRDLASARSALLAHATRGGIGRIEALPDLPGFAVTDFAPAVMAIRDALEQIDVPPPELPLPTRLTKRIDLEHADAEETAAGLEALFGANLLLPASETLPAALRDAPALGLRILGDERTNALLVSGSPDRVAEVQAAVALLDVPVQVASTWIHVYRMKHRDAAPISMALRQLAAGAGALGGRDGVPAPSIVADVEGNALLIEATPRVYEQLLALLEQLDRAEPEDAEER